MRGFWLGVIAGFAAAFALSGMLAPAVKPITRQDIYEATSAAISIEIPKAINRVFESPRQSQKESRDALQ